jgi:hypothetical protein
MQDTASGSANARSARMHPIFSRPRVHKKGSSRLKGGKREGGLAARAEEKRTLEFGDGTVKVTLLSVSMTFRLSFVSKLGYDVTTSTL